jgi:hypothetical protein
VLPFTNAALMCGQASAGGPPPWSGAPGYIGSGAFTEVAGDQSHDVPYPSGIMVEDILILHVEWYERTSVTPTVNAPAGWTQISQGQSFTLHTQAIFYKRADGTETGTVNIAGTGAGSFNDTKAGIISIYRGCVSTGTPYEGVAATLGQNTAPTGSAVTTTGADRTVANFIAITNSLTNCVPAAGWTEQYENGGTVTNSVNLVLHDKVQSTAGTVAAEATTPSQSRWRMVSLAFLPR